MIDTIYGLGGRLPLQDPANLTGLTRELYDRMVSTVVPTADAAGYKSIDAQGHLIGPFNSCLYRPEMSGSFLALQKQEEEHTSLSKRARQIVILSVGSVWKASYELYAHSAVASTLGFSAEAIQALFSGTDGAETANSPDYRLSVDAPRLLVKDDEKRFQLDLGHDSATFTFLVEAENAGEKLAR